MNSSGVCIDRLRRNHLQCLQEANGRRKQAASQSFAGLPWSSVNLADLHLEFNGSFADQDFMPKRDDKAWNLSVRKFGV